MGRLSIKVAILSYYYNGGSVRFDPDVICAAATLRKLAPRSRDPDQTRRLLALAEIYDGGSRSDAARIGGVTLQIVRDWVVRFNAKGPDGLLTGKGAGGSEPPRRAPAAGLAAGCGGWPDPFHPWRRALAPY